MRMRKMSYARVYNFFFSHTRSPQKTQHALDRWIRTNLRNSHRRLSGRIQFAKHLITIHNTQRVGQHIDSTLYDTIVHHQRLLTLGWIIYHLRPLQRRIIQYLWRPGGPMYQRTHHRMMTDLSTMQGVATTWGTLQCPCGTDDSSWPAAPPVAFQIEDGVAPKPPDEPNTYSDR